MQGSTRFQWSGDSIDKSTLMEARDPRIHMQDTIRIR